MFSSGMLQNAVMKADASRVLVMIGMLKSTAARRMR
jgi:hypothetical protein